MLPLTDWIDTSKLNINVHVGFVYKVTNLLTNKCYGGSKFIVNSRTNRYNKSWLRYKTSSNYVKQDISRIGIDNFKFEIIKGYSDYSKLHAAEIKLIKQLLNTGNCYNKHVGGRIMMDDEIVAKIQETFKRRGHPMKGKAHPNKGKHIDSGHHLNKGKKYFNNGIVNKIEFPDKIDLSIWNIGMLRYQKTPKSVVERRILNKQNYELDPKCCPICKIKIEFEFSRNKTCGSKYCTSTLIKNHHIKRFELTGKGISNSNIDEIYHTPEGEFKSVKKAAAANNVSVPTIVNRCKNNLHIIKYNSRIPKEWKGKTWKELGWDYIWLK